MLLYHYSTAEFPTIRSLVAQGRTASESITERNSGFFGQLQTAFTKLFESRTTNREMSYDRHVSLFLEPIPLNMPEIYLNRHDIWQSGMKMFEYEVNLDALDDDITFKVTETPEKTELLYRKQDWERAKTHPEMIPMFKHQILEMEKRKGYIGHGKNQLIAVAKPLSRGIDRYAKIAAQLALVNPEDGGFSQYAACIPHLMIYPGYKQVKYQSVKEITLR